MEVLAAMDRPSLRIIKKFSDGKGKRGQWETMADGTDRITIAWKAHQRTEFGHDMVNTLIHEVVHHLRPDVPGDRAGEAWVRRQTAKLYTDDKVRAAAAIRLLNATYFTEEDAL
jgi:hypothetical protein